MFFWGVLDKLKYLLLHFKSSSGGKRMIRQKETKAVEK